MAVTVWKFQLEASAFQGVQEIEMSAGAKIIKVGLQRGHICLWAWYNDHPDAPKAMRRIAVVGTGHPAPSFDEAEHLGSVIMDGGNLVWHVFERKAA